MPDGISRELSLAVSPQAPPQVFARDPPCVPEQSTNVSNDSTVDKCMLGAGGEPVGARTVQHLSWSRGIVGRGGPLEILPRPYRRCDGEDFGMQATLGRIRPVQRILSSDF